METIRAIRKQAAECRRQGWEYLIIAAAHFLLMAIALVIREHVAALLLGLVGLCANGIGMSYFLEARALTQVAWERLEEIAAEQSEQLRVAFDEVLAHLAPGEATR